MAIKLNQSQKSTVGGITVNKEIRDPNYNSWNSPSPSYGSYLNQPTSPISVPKPVTLGGTTLPALTPIGGQTVKLPPASSYAANLKLAGSMGGSKGGVTDEGVVTNPTPQIPQIKDSSSSPASSGNTYSNWLTDIAQRVGSVVSGVASGFKNGINTLVQKAGDTPQKTTLPMSASDSATRSNLAAEAGSSSTSSVSAEKPAEETTKETTSAWAGTEPIDSYEEFLRNKETTLGEMRDETTAFYDKQNQETLDYLEQQRQQATDYATTTKETTDAAIQAQKDASIAQAEEQKNLLISMSEEQKQAVYAFAEAQGIADKAYAAEQYQLLLDSINAQKESGMTMATEQRELLLSMSEEQRQAAYKHAEERKNSSVAYANQQYQTLVDAINAQKESGLAMAEEQRQLLLSMSEEQRNALYAAAEQQRVAAEQRADTERERGVVDARSSYEQNKATYGANAEAMGSMGLAGSGYSDYLNSRAYAQQRAETQAANAQADASKREARYTEDQARLSADAAHYQNKYNAEQAYSDRKYEIDTSYRTNMLNAEQNKNASIYEAEETERDAKYSADSTHKQNEYNAEAQYSQNKYEVDTTYQSNLLGANQSKAEADYAAESAERETKFNADQSHAQNKYAAESGYSEDVYDAESAERESKLQSDLTYGKNIFDTESSYNAGVHEANQTADAGKFGANLTYKQNILDNDTDIGAYRQEQEEKAEAAAKEEAEKAEQEKLYAREAYTGLLEGANSGAYTADQLTQLAKDYGLSAEQTQSLVSAAEGYTKKQQAAANSEISSSTGDIVGTVQGAVDNGSISKEQGQTHVYNAFKDEISYGNADTGAIDRAYQSGNISQEQYNDLKQRWNDNVETSSDFFFSNGTMLNKSAAKQALDNLTKSSWCSAATKNSLTAIYNSLYSPIQKDVSFNNDGGWWIFGSTDTGADGNNFSVIKDGTKYRVQYGGEVTDTNIKEVASGVGDGKCFGYQEKIYIKQNGKVYLVEERDNSYGDHDDSLYNIFFGSGDTTSVQSANNAGSAAKTGTGAWKSYSDASAAGYSNIMTQTEWARRKASTGCNTYQEYLDKMYAKYMK